jgi:hypothetical protein
MLNFRYFIEGQMGLNAPGRAGQHVWKPETPILHDPDIVKDQGHGTKHSKTVDISNSYKPMIPVPLKGMTAKDFGSKIKRVPKPKI